MTNGSRDLSQLIALGPGDGARIRRIAPNPAGAIEALFAIDGDFTAGPVDRVFAHSNDDVPANVPVIARRLRLFHVNDMHNHLYDTDADGRVIHRLAQMVAHVGRARAAAGPDEAVLFLSAGDDHTGTVLDELVGWGPEDFVLDPSYRALSAAGCDAAAIGNHEFDRGAAQLARGLRDARFPLLSANVHSSAHLCPGQHYHAALLAQVKGLRVGIVGLTTRVETRVGQPGDPTLAVASPVEVLGNLLPLVDRLADVVVILSHCGYGDGAHVSGKAAVARDIGEADFALADLAAALASRPTVLVGAHTHTRLNQHGIEPQNLRSGILIAQAEAMGAFLGEITLAPQSEPPLQSRLHPIGAPDTPHDQIFARDHVEPLRARVAKRMEQVIAPAAAAGLGWPETRDSRYCGECALANFMNDAMVAELSTLDGPTADLALLNGASILSGVGPGAVSFGAWFDVMPYSDEVFLLTLTGRDLEALLHSNANRILRPEELPSTDTSGFVARGFLHASSALRYRITLNDDAAQARAEAITFQGRPLSDQYDRPLRVAMTTYLALGSFGERWNGLPLSGGVPGDVAGFDLRPFPRQHTGLVYRNVLVEHIRRLGNIEAALDGRLRLAPAR